MNIVDSLISPAIPAYNKQPLPVAKALPVNPRPDFSGNGVKPLFPKSNLLNAYLGVRFSGKTSEKSEINPDINPASPPEHMTFDNFMTLVRHDPHKYLPTGKRYLVQGLESWGYEEKEVLGEKVRVYQFPQKPWIPDGVQDRDEFCGQELVLNKILEKLKELQDSKSSYIIQLVGPNGCGKSVLVDLIQQASEMHSQNPGGERYSFSIIFAKQRKKIGFESPEAETESVRSVLPKEEEITFRLPSAMNVNPIFLLSQKERSSLIKELKASGKLASDENYDFFITGGDLDQRSRKVINALKRQCGGDLNKVLKDHIRVERVYDERVVIPPDETPHAHTRQLLPEIKWDELPAVLRNIGGLSDYGGPLIRANGGIFSMDDMGRSRSGGYEFTYLLETAQTGRLTLGSASGHHSVQEPIDITFFSTANPDGLGKMAQTGNFAALKDRMITIIVPHERRYGNEMQVHRAQFEQAKTKGRKIAPHVQESYALWVILTRLLPIDWNYKGYEKAVESKKLDTVLPKVDLLKKALLYQGQEDINAYLVDPDEPTYISKAEHGLLKQNLKLIANEHMQSLGETNFVSYEGALGLSPRESNKTVVPAILNLHPEKPLTVLDVFEALKKYIDSQPAWTAEREKFWKEKVNDRQGSPSLRDLLRKVEDYARKQFLHELKEAVAIYQTDEEHIELLQMYYEQAQALVNAGDPVLAEVREGYRRPANNPKPNESFISDIEKAIFPSSTHLERKEKRNEFLAKMKRRNGIVHAEDMKRIYANELTNLKAYDEKSEAGQRKLKQFKQDVVLNLCNPTSLEQFAREDVERRQDVERMKKALDTLTNKLGYPVESLPELMNWGFSSSYISTGSLSR